MASPSMVSAVKPSGSSVRSAKSSTANPTEQRRRCGRPFCGVPYVSFLAEFPAVDGH